MSCRSFVGAFLAAIAFALASEGCGGSSDRSPLPRLSFASEQWAFGVFDDEVSQPACTFAYMSPVSYGWCYPNCAGLPKGGPSVRVVDTGGAFSPASVSLDVLGGDAEKVVFIACLYVQSGLPAGTYPGGLAFHVCTYAPDECADATLPYVLTMRDVVEGLPPLTATFEVDGALASSVDVGLANDVRTYGLSVRAGQLVEVDPSAPIVETRVSSPWLRVLDPPQPGEALVRPTLPSGASSASLALTVRAEDGRTMVVTLDVAP